jgi:hypothetical protein
LQQNHILCSFRVGETFGDRALDSSTSLRTATVVSCNGHTELLVIYKEDYYNIVSVINQKAAMDKIILLRKNPIFKNVDMTILKALAKVMSPRTYQLDEVLYYENDKAMNMIIIAVGECVAEVEVHSQKDIVHKPSPHYLTPKASSTLHANTNKRTGRPGSPKTARSFDAESLESADESQSYKSLESQSQLSTSVISKQRRETRANVGRLGTGSILAPFVATCESIMEEVYHHETVTAATLLTAYVVFKNDFIHHIQEPVRTEIRKLLKASPTYLMPELWDLHSRSLGEMEWKSKKAWDLFKKDLRAGKGTSITTTLHRLQHLHRTDASGNRVYDESSNSKNKGCIGPSKLASTLAGFTEAFLTRSNFERAQIKKLTSSLGRDKLVDVEINASKRRVEEKQMHIDIANQPDFHRHNTYIPPEERNQNDRSFGLNRMTMVYPAAMAEVITTKHDANSTSADFDVPLDPTSYIQAKGLVTRSIYPLIQHPYSLIHIHRENYSSDNKAMQPRVSYCYYRLSGTMQTLLEAKNCAARQMKHAYINCLTQDNDIDQPEIILDWKTFSSFDTVGVANTDFYIAYFRSVPMEVTCFVVIAAHLMRTVYHCVRMRVFICSLQVLHQR